MTAGGGVGVLLVLCSTCGGQGEIASLVQHTSGDPQDAFEAMLTCLACEGAGTTEVDDAGCVAIYDAVVMSCMTRDVKPPEKKAAIVRRASALAALDQN